MLDRRRSLGDSRRHAAFAYRIEVGFAFRDDFGRVAEACASARYGRSVPYFAYHVLGSDGEEIRPAAFRGRDAGEHPQPL